MQLCKSMKKNLAIYFALLVSALSVVSCGSETEENVEFPYAMVRSFKLGDIRSAYHAFTSTGKDTTITKTVSMASVPFSIDQGAGRIYNCDSLLFGTDVSKVTITMSADGIPAIYDDSTEVYNNILTTDSIDFTRPRKIRVYSLDETCHKDYEVSVNVHRVNPDLMEWTGFQAPQGVVPMRAQEYGNEMCLFGVDETQNVVVARALLNDTVWNAEPVSGLPIEAIATINVFNGKLYAVANGDVYSSVNAVDWSVTATGTGAVAIVGASDEESMLWIAGEQGLLYSADGESFVSAGALPEGFPLYGVSLASYPLSHNSSIVRYMLVGYQTAEKEGNVSVWCKLSNENGWTCYDSEHNALPCPALKDIAVLHYDNFLYALGGAGKVNGTEVGAFASFYISRDNGIAWRKNESFYQRMPSGLAGCDSSFAAAADSRGFMWIIAGGNAWKGIINRLGFEK